uniref:CCR4-NOT transcription complex subunit 1 n=1 Tax=Acrobeloides nanus TaxID=290746 RepID=A0A914CS85_9BILA
MLNATNVDVLMNATDREGSRVPQPPPSIVERVAFLCNNLSQVNLRQKTEEIKVILRECGENFLRWFAQYLVMKRVTLEQNFQPLYNSFLLSINDENLDRYVKQETFRNIKILLRSDKGNAASNFGDRQLLKNLGLWLGQITISRNKPILTRDLDLKCLLFEAFYKGQQELLYVVPFVAKTLLSCTKSELFIPTCAWIFSIIRVLAEIHNEPDLKLNLKFEIEVLCKDLGIDLSQIEPTGVLKDTERLVRVPQQLGELASLSQPESGSQMPLGPPPMGIAPPIDPGRVSGRASANLMPPTSVTPVNELSAIDQAKHGAAVQPPSIFLSASFNYGDINVATLDGLAHHINIPANLPLFNTYPELKAAVRPAINQAVKELIGAIGERAISVAIAVTEQVCKKDFALDPNPQHLRRGAHQMARSMTAAMAWITCREPLQNTILGYLKHYFTTHLQQAATNPEIAKLIEEAVLQTMEANIELATNFIVKTACEQAMIEVDKRFEKEITARQQAAKELKTFGEDSPQIKIQLYMPESIRILPGPISDADMKIYDDYSSKICGFKPNQNFDESAFRNQQMVPPSLSQAQFPTQMGASRPIGTTSSMAPNFNQAQFAGQLSGGRIPANIDPNLFASQGNRMTSTTPTLGPDVSQAIIEQLRANRSIGNATPMLGMQPLEQHQLEQLRSKVELIVREWMAICFTSVTQQDPRRALAHIVQSMHREGILMTDETVTKFFHIYVNICVDVTHRLLNSDSQGGQISVRHRCYLTLDAFTKLTCLMVRYSDGPQHSTRINLLKKVLNIVTQALHHSHENRKGEFDGMPFMRIILNLFSNLARVNDPILDPISWNILESFGQSLFVTQPRRAPGFTFHWLTIIGHRDFIGRLLADESQDPHRTGAMYTQLLLCHIKFLAPYLRNLPLPQSIQTLLKGTLRVLLVILHDFPELLCEYHYVYCDYIPPDCIQLRNLILSAYPRNMRLPDPFNESMEMIENLQDMAVNPKAHREMANIIQAPELKAKLDEYLETRSAVNFLSELPSYLQVSQVPGSKYNSSTMNAIVLYVGTRAIDALQAKKQKISIQTVAHTPYMDIFQNLAVSLCTEGRHLLFNSIANQLRYPNSHTHYFSCTMLYLFLEANLEVIQEQITRILFQRLVALRPHPWGLLITFVELIRNPQYGFWGHEFIRCAPEIEQLFISVANSCNVNPQQILAQQKRV